MTAKKSLVSVSLCLLAVIAISLLAACSQPTPSPSPSASPSATAKPSPTSTASPTATASPSPSPTAKKTNYLVATTSVSSGSYPHAVKMTELWSRLTPYNFTPVATGATYDNIDRIRRGELMIGFITTRTAAIESYAGIGFYKGQKPDPKSRVIFDYSIPPIYWVVRADSGITDIAQLSGKPYAAGIAGASSTAMVFQTFKALGLDDSKLQTGNSEDLTNAILDKRLIGITKASGNVELDSQLLTIQASTPIRLLGLTEAQWKKFQDSDPLRAWVRFDLPANTLKALPGHPAIITQSFITGCQGNSDLPQEVGYQMVKTAVATWDEWGAAGWKSNQFYNVVRDQLKDWPPAPHAPLHAGTVQFLKEKGVNVPAEFIPPEYKP